MPIELPCRECGQHLRVPDESAGLQARCPRCQAVTNIPASSTSRFAEIARNPVARESVSRSPLAPVAENPYASPGRETWNQRALPSHLAPHRGGLVLALGILSVICLPLLGPLVWLMGYTDLTAIRAGQRDPDGASQTQAGMILGMISTALLFIMAVGCGLLYLLHLSFQAPGGN